MAHQCPNCGGYKTHSMREYAKNSMLSCNSLLGLVLLSWTIIYPLIWLYFLIVANKEPEHLYKCNLCGFKWEQRPGEKPPVNIRPDLIAKGEQRLKKEEEKRKKEAARAAAAHHWRQRHR